MKKKFVKVSLFCALAATASTAFVACADYDDDIKNLQEQVDANKTLAETLDAQIQDLKKAQETANAEIQAAKDAAAAAQEAADKANELAKQAAAEAKAEAIEEATKLVEALKADIEAKNYATTEELNAAITSVNSKIASIEEGLNGKINGINSTIEGLDGRVSEAEKLIEELKTQKLAVETFEQYKKDAALEVDKKIAGLKETLDKAIADAEQNAKTYTDDQIKALKSDLEKQINAVNVNLITLLGETLRSLVFVPDLYVDGIEAVEYGYLSAVQKGADAVAQSGQTPATDGSQANFTINGTLTNGNHDYIFNKPVPNVTEYNPEVKVSYHMNPSSAKVDENGLSFVDREVEVISRAAGDGKISYVKGSAVSENGVLTVGLTAKGSQISSRYDAPIEGTTGDEDPDATIFALQSKVNVDGKDTTITSDYAMLYASVITPQAIAFTDESGIKTEQHTYAPDNESVDCPGVEVTGTADNELYVKPKYAGEKGVDAKLFLKYNDPNGINLLDKLCLHYVWKTNTSNKTNNKHRVMTIEEAKKYGLSFEFNMVNFVVGGNQTSDSKFLNPNKIKDGVAVACIVENNDEGTGTSIPDKQGVSSIGRHPMVQVLVRDKDNNVILDGYIKLEIVREIENKICDHSDFGIQSFGCSGATVKQNWDEVSYKLYELAAVSSKEEFEAMYELELVSGTSNAVQYGLKANTTNEFETLTDYVGQVTRIVDPNPGTTTNVLQWALGLCDLENVYHSTADAGRFDGSADNAKTIYVRYKLKSEADATDNKYAGIFVPLTIHVAKPQASVSERIAEYWYNDMDNWYGRYDGVHVNVQQPMDNSDTKEFVYNLYSAWVGNKIQFSGVGAEFTSYTSTILAPLTYAGNTNHGGHMFYFRPENEGKEILGVDGKTYVLSVASTSVVKKCGGTTVSVANGELTSDFEKNNALVAKQGVYANDVLYARVKGTAAATNVKVAEIKQGTGAYATAPTLIINNNPTTKAILNTYAHDDAKSWTAFIGITAMSSPCDVTLSLTNNVYPARIQRPVDIEPVEGSVFTDAEENSSIVDLFDLFDYSDWRDIKFINGDDITKAWLFAYYGFKSAKADIDNITTTMNGGTLGETLLSSVSTEVKFDQIDESPMTFTNVTAANYAAIYNKVRSSFGKIKYDNNRGNVKDFKVRIPVDFEYEWGTIRVYVDCDVKNTIGN